MPAPAVTPETLEQLRAKYQRLIELRQAPAERSEARRAALQEVAARFPTALREWESLPLGELQRRHDHIAQLLQGGDPPEEAALEPWLRYVRELHPLLRQLLKDRRDAPGPPPPGDTPLTQALVTLAERHGLSVAELKRALFRAPGPR